MFRKISLFFLMLFSSLTFAQEEYTGAQLLEDCTSATNLKNTEIKPSCELIVGKWQGYMDSPYVRCKFHVAEAIISKNQNNITITMKLDNKGGYPHACREQPFQETYTGTCRDNKVFIPHFTQFEYLTGTLLDAAHIELVSDPTDEPNWVILERD